ncbi:MAG TPA: carboxypeptidase regulatory-like domain-containing protein [Gemmatimonadaceae bacterium]|nr:carboxypeptidase regulatory-like domain-containing protein [Gemmatimonadaceae bacterium]
MSQAKGPRMRSRYSGAVRKQLAVAGLLGLLAILPSAVTAQGTLRGVVVDSASRAPVPFADVSIIALHLVARADSLGRFTLNKLPKGPVEVSIRRIGYEPQRETMFLTGGSNDSVLVTLVAQPEVLSAIEVSAGERRRRQMVEDFYVRRARGIGSFVTREDLEARHARLATDALNMPGVSLQRTRYGMTVRFMGTAKMRRDCEPTLWVDGQRAPNMELDEIPVNDIEGIELYHGPSTTPAQFWQGNTSNAGCGTIVVWSRVPGI